MVSISEPVSAQVGGNPSVSRPVFQTASTPWAWTRGRSGAGHVASSTQAGGQRSKPLLGGRRPPPLLVQLFGLPGQGGDQFGGLRLGELRRRIHPALRE